MIKQDIVHHVIERTGLPRTKAEAAVDTVFEGLKQALASGERIELRGFGVFSVRARKTGIGRNPRTGTEVSIAPGKAVRFKPGKELHAIEPGEEVKKCRLVPIPRGNWVAYRVTLDVKSCAHMIWTAKEPKSWQTHQIILEQPNGTARPGKGRGVTPTMGMSRA